jgi:hypothetical protein
MKEEQIKAIDKFYRLYSEEEYASFIIDEFTKLIGKRMKFVNGLWKLIDVEGDSE